MKAVCDKTDVGLVPDSWGIVSLGQITDFITKGSTPTTYGFKWETSGILFLRSECVSPRGLDLGQSMFISPAAHRLLRRSEVRDGDLLITITGNVGRVVMLRGLGVANINQHIARIRISATNADAGYVYHVLSQPGVVRRFESITTGQAYPQISLKQVREAEVPLPELPEQRAIATALSDVDSLLEGLDRMIAKKRDLKQAAMQQLLTGQTRLPGFEGEWETKRLGDHVTFLRNGVNARAELTADDPVKYLHYGDIHAQRSSSVSPDELPSLPTQKAKGLGRLADGDLVFADASEDLDGVGKSVEIQDVGDLEVVAGLHTIAARFDKNILADGFKAYLQFCPNFIRHLRKLAAGTKVYATNRAHIASVEMALPSVEEQVAIASVFSDMDTELDALEQRRAKTAALKHAMMQELLTGKTRLVAPQVSDVQVEAASSNAKGHNWAINEAVIIAVLVKQFGKEDYPLGRKRYTKLSYLLHRRVEQQAEGYLKKAAGPYNPQTKYGGPEKIAKQNGYIKQYKGPKGHGGFIVADNIAQAEGYFEKWYGPEVLQWLKQFRFKTNDDLEVLATVDMAAVELRASGESVNVGAVKNVIASHPEWQAKLDRPVFSDANIAEAIKQNDALLDPEIAGGTLA